MKSSSQTMHFNKRFNVVKHNSIEHFRHIAAMDGFLSKKSLRELPGYVKFKLGRGASEQEVSKCVIYIERSFQWKRFSKRAA